MARPGAAGSHRGGGSPVENVRVDSVALSIQDFGEPKDLQKQSTMVQDPEDAAIGDSRNKEVHYCLVVAPKGGGVLRGISDP